MHANTHTLYLYTHTYRCFTLSIPCRLQIHKQPTAASSTQKPKARLKPHTPTPANSSSYLALAFQRMEPRLLSESMLQAFHELHREGVVVREMAVGFLRAWHRRSFLVQCDVTVGRCSVCVCVCVSVYVSMSISSRLSLYINTYTHMLTHAYTHTHTHTHSTAQGGSLLRPWALPGMRWRTSKSSNLTRRSISGVCVCVHVCVCV
jgi:hypothetical protein